AKGTNEDPEVVFKNLISKTADIIRRMSGTVSVDTLETGLAIQYTTISDLGRLVPLPLIGGQPVVEVGATYARVYWTTDKPASSLVAFAPDSTYKNNQEYTQVIGRAFEAVENHDVLLSELKPNTTYHYQVRSKTSVSDTAKTKDFTFTTKNEQAEIITYKIDSVSDNEAIFSWTTNIPTDSKVVYMPYGKDGVLQIDAARQGYDKAVTTLHEVKIKDMEAGLTYQIELSGTDLNGNIISKTLSTFSTSEIDAPPVITQVQTDTALLPGDQTAVQAIVSWITNEPATSQIFYQKGFGRADATKELSQKTPYDPSYIKRHIMVITKFEPGSVYQFQVESTDSSQNTTRSRTYTLLTPRQKESVLQVIMGNLEETFGWVGQLGL
ncbi:MAG: fibronectin type III domain-containing protein, partial [bacterium]|nr:fibronectin type III domain-containing protein [bacterium]